MTLSLADVRHLLSHFSDPVVLIDSKGTVRAWNDATCRLLGTSSEEVLGKSFYEMFVPVRHRGQDIYKVIGAPTHPDEALVELELVVQPGKEIWVEASLSLLPIELKDDDSTAPHLILILRDTEQRKQRELLLKHEAREDVLSGLANRRQFQSVLEDNIEEALTLVIIDIDLFKSVNDNYGHPVGDAGIQAVALALTEVFGDALCIGRLGGDEFGTIHNTDPNANWESRFASMQQHLQRVSAAPYQRLTVSMGVGVANTSQPARRLLSMADQALYSAKSDGRNTVCLRKID